MLQLKNQIKKLVYTKQSWFLPGYLVFMGIGLNLITFGLTLVTFLLKVIMKYIIGIN